MLLEIVRRTQKSVRRRGVMETIKLVAPAVVHDVRARLTGGLQHAPGASATSLRLDQEYGIDTAGAVELTDLSIGTDSWIYGVRYQPIGATEFHRLLRAVPIPFEECAFVDIGSGKGRALVLASEYPFRRIAGVEFSEALHQAAEKNLRAFRGQRRCEAFELYHLDALAYDLPEGPLVLFLYNPFGAEIMAPLVRRVGESLAASPRSIYVLYENPRHGDLWEGSGFVKRVAGDDEFAVYSNVPVGLADAELEPAATVWWRRASLLRAAPGSHRRGR